ncbi:hypothetical protein P691DRAFT_767855 [Macrolepiota fuliginosa MF-IS2]|uniref:Uncharacterized protein n=1 Tax=Macrolepiota fuliginosa MF-IS2 TaxID=1400762 RepID=A0A9P5WWM2_9AGAR|nr:hypothetical protein P691DRAFT_767855 [Macrolepiota fuliginosa MF-IS2]
MGFTPSDMTCHYLNMMKQDLCMKSLIQLEHLKTIPLALHPTVLDDLVAMGFDLPSVNKPDPAPTPAAFQEICNWFRPNFFQHSNVEEHNNFTIHICNLVNVLGLINPPQSPSPILCSCPHSNEDIPIEPPALTCVLSEAAMQTPAPIHMEATPPPPTPPAPAAIPPTADAAARPLCPEAPSADISLPNLSTLWVDSACISPNGIMCAMASVPSTSDLNTIEVTLPAGLTGAHVTIPTLQLFIKIMDMPYFKPGTTKPPTGTKLAAQLAHSPILLDEIKHSHFMHNSPKADSGTFWINLADSWKHAATQWPTALSVLDCITCLPTIPLRGVAKATPRPTPPPSHSGRHTLLTCLPMHQLWSPPCC